MSPAETTFTTDKMHLSKILEQVEDGRIQLPDFQRGWIWDDQHIVDLIESVSLGYPIGTIMLMETGGEGVRFKPRTIDGVESASQPPDYLILDGQQRLTSLYQALRCQQVVKTRDTRKKPINRWYYMDMAKALKSNGDRAEAILSLPESRMQVTFGREIVHDLSTPALEFKKSCFPLNAVFRAADWRRVYNRHWDRDGAMAERYDEFEEQVIERFKEYLVPVIIVKRETPKEAICQVFEKVNTGGVSLTAFELLTASFAADGFELRPDWATRQRYLRQHQVLRAVQDTDFLQGIALLTTYQAQLDAISQDTAADDLPAVSCKRREILRLNVAGYKKWADPLQEGFVAAARFLRRQHVFTDRDLSYRTQLVPLAAVFAWLGKKGEPDGVQAKLARWFWCGVLGELYGSAVESRFARDLPDLVNWLQDRGPTPRTIEDANFSPSRLYTLRTRNSAAYKGIHVLLMRRKCLDFRSGVSIEEQAYFDDHVDIHHIFPRAWCDAHGIDAERRDAILNKTALSARTNRMIGGNAPSGYLVAIAKEAGVTKTRMDAILRTHAIDPDRLRADDYDGFESARESALLDLIEQAMGKPVMREAVTAEERVAEDYEGNNGEAASD